MEQLLNMNSLSLQDKKIVVGVDFGTTFSGIAWANTVDVRSTFYFVERTFC